MRTSGGFGGPAAAADGSIALGGRGVGAVAHCGRVGSMRTENPFPDFSRVVLVPRAVSTCRLGADVERVPDGEVLRSAAVARAVLRGATHVGLVRSPREGVPFIAAGGRTILFCSDG